MKYAVADSDMLERLVASPAFAMQEKIDGERLTVEVTEQGIKGYNKRGKTAGLSRWLYQELEALPRTPWKFDGEYARGGYFIFDLMNAPVDSLSEKTFTERQKLLNILISTWGAENVHAVKTWVQPKEKLRQLMRLGLTGAEGVVFHQEQISQHYHGQVYKYKFRNTVDAVVLKSNEKASIEVGVYRANQLTSIGNCPVNGNVEAGEVVEISYRRLSESGRMIEPVFVRVRDDKLSYSCTWDQLTEGKHLQDEALLDRQASRIAKSLDIGPKELHDITTKL